MQLYVVGIGSYRTHEPKVCDCFISLVLADDITQARVKGGRMCKERYSYLNGWDEAGGVEVELLEQGMQVGQYILNYSIKATAIEENRNKSVANNLSIYATLVTSHYYWVQDEYPECLLSIVTAHDISEAEKLGEATKEQLFSIADGNWVDSYAVTALRLEDIIEVENHRIQWSIIHA